ncbi:MAG: ABC transporter permease [Deltaproteobacteria bacterium]|nr:ABC transporter permease [Deltaproteobacteria bacterium]
MENSVINHRGQLAEILIEPGQTERQYWRDLWNYRELFFFLAWRDILVRYKQTVIGVVWALIRPLLTMVVLSVVFGKWAKMPSEGVPYPILVLAAMLPWQFFANSFSGASNSLITNTSLISKIYFPRLIIPTSSVVVSLVDFLISAVILMGLMAWYDFWPTWRITALPLLILIAITASLGAGVWISALNVKYRDFRYVVPFIVQFGLYISPVGFSSSVVPDRWRLVYSLNPMVGVIDGFRWAILGKDSLIYAPGLIVSTVLVVLLLYGGIKYFRSTERTFADVI